MEIVTLAAGANASSLMHQAGQWGRIVLGKAGWMEKDEGVRSVHHWRIQGCVPPAASEWAWLSGSGEGWAGMHGQGAAGG